MENMKKYYEIFMNVFNVSENQLNEKFTFKDTDQWTSLAHITLITEIENEFDIIFDTEDILNYGSFTNGINILRKYGVSL